MTAGGLDSAGAALALGGPRALIFGERDLQRVLSLYSLYYK